MIEVEHLTKRHPGRVAVSDANFKIAAGSVVGFVGPNGAGKTTTLRMIVGYLAPTGGVIRIGGLEVATHPMEVRRLIGYLPENCPLYPEMRVDEYLKFRARLKGVRGENLRSRLTEVKELCGLANDGRRLIGQLSKGYRQRVGLAESIIHEPKLLVLDEPTIGLDPNQTREIREMVTQLAKRCTILLSTHHLAEVEAICSHAIFILSGRIVASDSIANLKSGQMSSHRVFVAINGPPAAALESLRAIPGVGEVKALGEEGEASFVVSGQQDADLCGAIFRAVAGCGWTLSELRKIQPTLEEFYLAITRGRGGGGA